MKSDTTLILAFIFLFPLLSKGQNLVLNYSFEDTIFLISNASTPIDSLTHYWQSPSTHGGTPDYFHSEAGISTGRSVPTNSYGFQDTCHRLSYTGIYIYTTNSQYSYREYLTGELDTSLITNQCYKVSLHYSLSEYSDYSVSNFGIFFSDSIPLDNSTGNAQNLNYSPQVTINQWMDDKEKWVKVERYFVAQGEERYITLGNFLPNINSTANFLGNGSNNDPIKASYVYLDNILIEAVPTLSLPQINLGADTLLCEGEELVFDSLLPDNPVYVWNNLIESSDSTFTIDSSGTYWVEAYNGCSYTTDTISVEFVKPNIELGNDTILCKRQELTLLTEFTHPQVEFLWNTGDAANSIVPEDSGTYWLQVNVNHCKDIDSVYVGYHIPLNALLESENIDTILCIDGILGMRGSNWADTYQWNTGEPTQSIEVIESGVYEVYIENECTEATSTYSVTVEGLEDGYSPINVFTPNGDGHNDLFSVYNGNSDEYRLEIYNRWGKLIWETTNPKNHWDGNEVSDGTYYYHLSFNNCAGETIEKKSTIQLLR